MTLSPAELVTLKAELDTTYAAFGDDLGGILDQINDPNGPDSIPSFDVERVAAEEAVAAVVHGDFVALDATTQRAWLMVTGLGSVRVKDSNMRDLVQAIWSGTDTLTNLQALQTRRGSHAESLFGQPVVLPDLWAARRL